MGPANTNFDQRIYFLSIHCGENYPKEQPQVRFMSKVNLPSVNSQGVVEPKKFPLFIKWNWETTIEKILIGLKQEMIANKKQPQPADGDMY